MLRLLRSTVENESFIHEIVKEKEMYASFAAAPQTEIVKATVGDKCLVKTDRC